MNGIIIVTKDKRIPESIKNSDYTILTKKQFLDKVLSDKGLDISEGLFYNIDSLDKDIYEALKEITDFPITYYKFNDQNIKLSFTINEDIQIYSNNDEECIEEKQVYEKQCDFISEADNTLDAANFIISVAHITNRSIESSFNSIEFVNLTNMEKIIAYSNALYIENNCLLLITNFPSGDAAPIIEPLLFTPPDDLLA